MKLFEEDGAAADQKHKAWGMILALCAQSAQVRICVTLWGVCGGRFRLFSCCFGVVGVLRAVFALEHCQNTNADP